VRSPEPDLDGAIPVSGRVLRLRTAGAKDLQPMLSTAQDLWLGIPDPAAVERAEFVVREFSRGGWDGHFGLARLVVEEESDALVAQICLIRRASCLEVTYGVAPAHRGRGIATGVLRFVTDRTLGPVTDRIEAIIDPRNHRSIRVVTKAGYAYAGTNSDDRDAGAARHPDLVYARELHR
jgi:RimJ/RimL family protein N-acetyltransferase